LVADSLPTLITKTRYAKLFDVAVIGFYHTQHAGKDFAKILRDQHSIVYIELPKNHVGIKKEIKEVCYKRQADIVKGSGLKMLKSPYDHHYLFGFTGEEYVEGEEIKSEPKKVERVDEEEKGSNESKTKEEVTKKEDTLLTAEAEVKTEVRAEEPQAKTESETTP